MAPGADQGPDAHADPIAYAAIVAGALRVMAAVIEGLATRAAAMPASSAERGAAARVLVAAARAYGRAAASIAAN